MNPDTILQTRDAGCRSFYEGSWHPSQQVDEKDPGLVREEVAEVQMELSNLVDVVGMGPCATMLSPKPIRDRMRQQLASAYE